MNNKNSNTFMARCQSLFGERLGYGRRWKTAAAQALGIGRATLYRYFGDEGTVAPDVSSKLELLERPRQQPTRSDQQMVTLFARALLDGQRQIDEYGWLKNGYPRTLRRAFDLAAARNISDSRSKWPTDFAALSAVAQRPLFEWIEDLSWDPDGQFTAAALIAEGEITPACIDLALPGRDPEAELIEKTGYSLLRSICRERRDGQAIYAAFRRLAIENPVLSSWTTTLTNDPKLASLERLDEIIYTFYQRVPESMVVQGSLPLCSVSGTILRRDALGFHTECRDPEAIRRARAGDFKATKWRPGTMQLRRPFRLYWCLPGRSELELARSLTAAGWKVELWPNLDRVDLSASSPDGRRRIAVDVKEYLSPENLAARFEGFKEYATDYECVLVVPDYMPEISTGYERRFEAIRASHSKTAVTLRTVSALLNDLEVVG